MTALIAPDAGPSSHRLAWLASGVDGAPVESAFLRLFTRPGQDHLAELELHVHPAERRRHTGSLLLKAAVAAARDDGRRSLITQAQALCARRCAVTTVASARQTRDLGMGRLMKMAAVGPRQHALIRPAR